MDSFSFTILASLAAAAGCLALLVAYLKERGWKPGKEPLVPAAAVLVVLAVVMNAGAWYHLRRLDAQMQTMTNWAAWLHDHQRQIESLPYDFGSFAKRK